MVAPTRVQTADFPLLMAARALWAAGRPEDALAEFERAVAAQPDNVRAIVECARALGQRYEIARAELLLQRAAMLAGSDSTIMSLIAQSYRLLHRPYQAITALESLRDARALPAPLLGELAVLFEQTNQLEKSLVAVRECIEHVPEQAEPQLVLARIQRARGESLAAQSLLEELTRRADVPPLLRIRAWSELGYLYDNMGDYDGAVAAMEQSKAMLRPMPQAQRLARRALAINESFAQVYSKLDAATIDAWRDESFPPDPRCSGIAHLLGFPRSGTTLLEQLLDAHPQLAASPERSVFSKHSFPAMCRSVEHGSLTLEALRSVPPECLGTQRRRYLDYMEAMLGSPLGGRVHLDKNPNHTSLIVGLLRLFPESRFVFAVRDPRDVIVSAYLRFFPLTEFSASLLTWEGTCRQYGFEMNVWLSVRELIADSSLQVRYEDVVNDPHAECRRALKALGLPWDDAIAGYRERIQHKVVNSPSQADVRKPVHRGAIGRWKNYARYVEPLLDRLDRFCQEFGYN
jgi:tetratricopeptide (TPR) repeat protein